MKHQHIYILFTAILLGFLIAMQSGSFSDYSDVIRRNSRADVFREIQILKDTNENLEDEIKDLEVQLSKTSNSQQALEGIREEIEKNRILAGRVDISGPGIAVTLNQEVRALWITDLVNELFTAGAEAVSVNNIRLTDKIVGFDTIPSGQILLNGVILDLPYNIEAIGDKVTLEQSLIQPQGIVDRMKQSAENADIDVEPIDLINMEKVL